MTVNAGVEGVEGGLLEDATGMDRRGVVGVDIVTKLTPLLCVER